MDQIKIGKFIFNCRKEKGLTQEQLAEKLGVTSVVMMSNKITLVTNLDNQKIEENIKNCLQN